MQTMRGQRGRNLTQVSVSDYDIAILLVSIIIDPERT